MKNIGLITEYNPFHNGHKYHIKQSLKLTNADTVVAVMSGNFVQRGEPAIVNKLSRAEMAMKNGTDIVIELPFVYSVQDAGGFAYGAVKTLDMLCGIDSIVFGSESADINLLGKIASELIKEEEKYDQLIKDYMKKGYSFPQARKFILMDNLDEDTEKIINKSNDILGIEYIKNLKKINSQIKPQVIKRIGADYNQKSISGKFSSATAIRDYIKTSYEKSELKTFIPENVYEILLKNFEKGTGPVFYENLKELVFYKVLTSEREELAQYKGVTEGMERRIIDAVNSENSLEDAVMKIKSKRMTHTRIKRTIINILFGITDSDINRYNEYGPQYIRVLAFNEKGKKFLAEYKKNIKVPVITTASQYYPIYKYLLKNSEKEDKKYISEPEIFRKMFETDLLATKIYSLLYPDKKMSNYNIDIDEKILIF
ncbi:MAG: nucleotidyltransferase [Thermotogae bacterium]|nr:nucleotidyltransferase [Thermotogota bacterium]